MPSQYHEPHGVTDPAKLEALIAILNRGEKLPPVAVQGDIAFTGSHRLAAYAACGLDPEVIEVSDQDYVRACYVLQIDHHDQAGAWNLFCAALYEVTGDDALKAALADQRNDYEDMSAYREWIEDAAEFA